MVAARVVRLASRRGPRTFTSNEEFIQAVQGLILTCGKTYKQLSEECNVGKSTIQNISSGKTRWPRHTTLFPLAEALGKKLALVDR